MNETSGSINTSYDASSTDASSVLAESGSSENTPCGPESSASSVDECEEDEPRISQDPQHARQELQAVRQDKYLEAIDEEYSQAEEGRLWQLLEKGGISQKAPKDGRRRMKPAPAQKFTDDLSDWTTWVNYASEWEVMETPLPE